MRPYSLECASYVSTIRVVITCAESPLFWHSALVVIVRVKLQDETPIKAIKMAEIVQNRLIYVNFCRKGTAFYPGVQIVYFF